MSEHEFEANDATFQNVVRDHEGAVLVDFWAPWCGPCRAIAPIVEEVAKELAGKLKVVKVNVDDSGNIASQLGIQNIPTLMVFRNGEVVGNIVGGTTKAKIVELVEPHL